MKRIISKSLDDTARIASDWLGSLEKKDSEALVVCLSGDLGSGKTAFTKAVAAALGINEMVTSPTYVIEKIYQIAKFGDRISRWGRLIHIDAYRLESARELEA